MPARGGNRDDEYPGTPRYPLAGKEMRFNRTLLISPHFAGEWKGIRPHIGLAYLSEYLKLHGLEHKLLDMNLGYKYHHLQKLITDFKPDLIGLTMISLQHKRTYELLELIRSN